MLEGAAKQIRIVLAHLPLKAHMFIREMVRRQEDMEIVGETLHPFDLLVAVKEQTADAVILSTRDSEVPGLCSHLLAEYPRLTVLALNLEAGRAFLKQLCPVGREITNPSGERVLAALRDAIREPCGWMEPETPNAETPDEVNQ